jgi:PAS domain S-box-containing protein
MKIRTQLHALLTVAAVALPMAFSAAALKSQDIRRQMVGMATSDKLLKNVGNLKQIAFEASLFHDPRSADQWQRAVKALQADLGSIVAEEAHEQYIVRSLRTKLETAQPAFARLMAAPGTTNPAAASDEEKRTVTSLLVITEEMTDASRDLSDIARKQLIEAMYTVQVTIGLILALMIALALFVWGLIQRKVLLPIKALEDGTRRIAAGSQADIVVPSSRNELGALANSFNLMGQQIQANQRQQDELMNSLKLSHAATQVALRESEALLRTINMHAIVSVADRAGRITDINEAFCKISGYSREELIGQNHRIVNSGAQSAEFWVEMWQAIAAGNPWRGEICNRAKDGSEYWVDSIIAPFTGEDGKVEKYISIRTDITQRKINELGLASAVRETEALLRTINMHAIVSVADRAGRITDINEAFCKISGYSREELIGQNHRIVNSGAQSAEFWVEMWQAIAAGNPWRGEICNRAKDGSEYWVDSIIAPFTDKNGKVEKYISIRLDITRLKQATQLAEQASQAKGQFLANMSHEIRTPMNAILGMLRLLRKTTLTPRQLDYTTKTQGAAQSLLSLLNDILDFSKVEAGKMELEQYPFEVERMLGDLAVILSANLGQKPVEVLFDIDPNVPPSLLGDAQRLQQVLINLGGNAVKFTPAGDVVLGVHVLSSQADRVKLRFSVRDSGIGIAPEAIERIFEGFSQAESSTTRKFGGTGLGLAISQRLVKLMGGAMAVTSTPGEGSTFSFDLDMTLAPDVVPDIQPPELALGALQVLIVDDNATARQVLHSMVEGLGWQADLAESGEHAIALIDNAHQSDKHYDAVFMDWQMPGMDGWQASQLIRQQLYKCHHGLMIVMVTAHGREELAMRSAQDQALVDAYLVKPITAAMLRHAVEHIKTGALPSPSNPAGAAANAPRLQGMRILLVEDNPNNQQVACELLEDEGALIQIANNGKEGVSAATASYASFDIILMDIQMPVMDGITAAAAIRKALADKAPPIVAMTANAMAKDREDSRAAGMVDHVGKPFDLDELVAVLCKHTGRVAAPAATQAASDIDVHEAIRAVAASQGIDLMGALHRLGGRQDVYLRLLRSFIKDLNGAIEQVDALWRSDNLSPLAQWLHTLKGLSATLGHQQLADVMAQGEQAARNPGQKEALSQWVAIGKAAIDHAILSLNALIRALEPASAAANDVPAPPLDRAKLNQQCDMLLELLQRSDMAAMDVFTEIQSAHGPALGSALTPLEEAMGQLDFQEATIQCQRLMAISTQE